MNPVFWILVIAALVCIWFVLTPLFRWIGGSAVNRVNKTKKVMYNEKEKTENEE